ncbi:MAG: hypothetical protein WBA57_08715 [Elainellaceae cyanobacterium]
MHYYSVPLSGAIAIGSLVATSYPVNSNGQLPWMNTIPEPNANIHGSPSGVVVPNVAPPPPSYPNPVPYQAPVQPALPTVQPSTNQGRTVLSRDQYRQITAGAATVAPGLYQVEWGSSPVAVMFADGDGYSREIGFSVGAPSQPAPQTYVPAWKRTVRGVGTNMVQQAHENTARRQERYGQFWD